MSKPELYVTLLVGPNCDTSAFAIRSTLEYFTTNYWNLLNYNTSFFLKRIVVHSLLN